ncbi:hypothetical protein [Geotalea toluenoxydans]|uniref:hypothetical protein n=1 Tax=Geotalea toluenoxydans TaxID=421624 RepID=UPI001FB53E58|nr:hypothetical protein [Geotalea toluenoxydans]
MNIKAPFAALILSVLATTLALAAPDARTLLKESEARHRTKTQQYSGNLAWSTRMAKSAKRAGKVTGRATPVTPRP